MPCPISYDEVTNVGQKFVSHHNLLYVLTLYGTDRIISKVHGFTILADFLITAYICGVIYENT